MELSNEFTVSASIDETFAVLTDIEKIAPCLPGAQLTEVEGDEYRGTVKIKVGPITASFKGTASLVERDETAHRAVLKAQGRDTGGKGNANATITAVLEPAGDGTHVKIDTDLNITGRVAQFGRGALADVSQKLIGQFAERLEAEVLSGNGASTGEGRGAAGPGRRPGRAGGRLRRPPPPPSARPRRRRPRTRRPSAASTPPRPLRSTCSTRPVRRSRSGSCPPSWWRCWPSCSSAAGGSVGARNPLAGLESLAAASADPARVRAGLARLESQRPGIIDQLDADPRWARALAAVLASCPQLTPALFVDDRAVDGLGVARREQPGGREQRRGPGGVEATGAPADRGARPARRGRLRGDRRRDQRRRREPRSTPPSRWPEPSDWPSWRWGSSARPS